jgi:hypothetical protein
MPNGDSGSHRIPDQAFLDLIVQQGKIETELRSVKEIVTPLPKRLTEIEKSRHSCVYPDEIDQAREIPAIKNEVNGLSTWRYWLMGIAVVLAGSGVTFAILSRVTEAAHAERIEDSEDDIENLDEDVDELDEQLQKTREEIIREVRAVPAQVKKAIPEPDIDDALEETALTDDERATIRRVLERAERRNGRDKHL